MDATRSNSPPLTPRRASHFPFLDLSVELRYEVYGYLVPSAINVPRPSRASNDPINPVAAVMCVSRQLYGEMKDVLDRKVTIGLWSCFGHSRKHRDGSLPTKAILESRSIHLDICIWELTGSMAERVVAHDEAGTEKEYLAACLLGEMTTIAALLRRRDSTPKLSVHFRFDGRPITPDALMGRYQARLMMQTFLGPLWWTGGAPSGIHVTAGEPFNLDQRVTDMGIHFTCGGCDTLVANPLSPLSVGEIRLVEIHAQYLDVKRAYDVFKPWDDSASGSVAGSGLKALEVVVKQFRVLRWLRVLEMLAQTYY